MNINEFEAVEKEFLSHEDTLLKAKREDYTKGDYDCLINFKEASVMLGMTPQLYCLTLLTKHYHSIARAVRKGGIDPYDWSWVNSKGEGMKQHIADARNFLLLLAGLIEEEVPPADMIDSSQTIILDD